MDYITTDKTDHEKVIFASPDWCDKNGSNPYQQLKLTWTTKVSSSFEHKSFKCGAVTRYNADKSVLKGFTANCYFIADDGIFSYDYFKDYTGTYSLSGEYKTIYGEDIEGIGDWTIQIDDGGHVYFCEGKDHYGLDRNRCAGPFKENLPNVPPHNIPLYAPPGPHPGGENFSDCGHLCGQAEKTQKFPK